MLNNQYRYTASYTNLLRHITCLFLLLGHIRLAAIQVGGSITSGKHNRV